MNYNFEQLEHFKYLNYFVEKALNGEEWKYKVVNMMGTRKSAKTIHIVDVIIKLLLLKERRVVSYVISPLVKDSIELFDFFKEFIDEVLEIPLLYFKINNTKRTISFGKNIVRFFGIARDSSSGRSQVLVGGNTRIKAQYGIVFFNEANKIGFDDRNAILEAIGNIENLTVMSDANPRF